MKILLDLGKGSLQTGFNDITIQLIDDERRYLCQFTNSLPPAPYLARLQRQWRSDYYAFYQDRAMRIGLIDSEGMSFSHGGFQQLCKNIAREMNAWLNTDSWVGTEKTLRAYLSPTTPFQIAIVTRDIEVQQLPWHLWQLIEDYPSAEITRTIRDWRELKATEKEPGKVNILAILGNSQEIDVEQDLASLQSLPNSKLTVLKEPTLAQLYQCLWQTSGWDILLFSGHSYSDCEMGYIYLNEREKITIAQLKYSLNKAILNGLQIAIFNSCAGMNLGLELADLSTPYTVVMGQPVPDRIAQLFLQYFLTAFAGGKSFTLAVKEARQQLAGWETEYICASWLPVIWQNPSTSNLFWSDLSQDVAVLKPERQINWRLALAIALFAGSLSMALRLLGWLEPLELSAYDRLMKQRPPETTDSRIVVVEIADEDLNGDRYPLSDSSLVEAISIIEQHQPAAIGLALHRSIPQDSAYPQLLAVLESNPQLFPICAYSGETASYAPPALSEAKLTQGMGFSDLLIDREKFLGIEADNTVRRQLLSYDPSLATKTSQCLTPYSLSFQLAFEYLSFLDIEPLVVNQEQQWQFGTLTLQEMSSKFGGYQSLAATSSQVAINYHSSQPATKISLKQLQAKNFSPQLIKDRIVLIGYTAEVARDYFETPIGRMAGVWIHAHMTNHLIEAVLSGRPLIWTLPQWADWFLILLWSSLTVTILQSLNHRSRFYLLIVLGGGILVIDRLYLFLLIQGVWLPYIPTILALLIVTSILLWQHPQTYKIADPLA